MRPKTPSQVLKAADVPALLITDLINIRYLSGLQMTAGVMLITKRQFLLFVDGRYKEMAEKNARKNVVVKGVEELEKTMKTIRQCGCESEKVTLAQMRRWKRKFKNTKFVQNSEILEEFRRSKEVDELRHFRVAQKITQKIMKKIPAALKPGITENQLAWKIATWAQELGADELSFDPIVAFGTNSSLPHHHPTDRKLTKDQVVQIDCGARYNGYCADQSAVFFTGKVTALQQKVYNAVLDAKEAAIALIKPGVTTQALDKAAREVLSDAGYEKYFVHSLGHGVGLEIHEGVTLSQKVPKQKLLKGEIVTIEPGVYIHGKFGIRLEEEVVV